MQEDEHKTGEIDRGEREKGRMMRKRRMRGVVG